MTDSKRSDRNDMHHGKRMRSHSSSRRDRSSREHRSSKDHGHSHHKSHSGGSPGSSNHKHHRNRRNSSPQDDDLSTFPIVKTKENKEILPKYTAVLAKGPNEYVMMDELDTLQLELETLLSMAARRCRAIQSEMDAIDRGEHRGDRKRTKSSDKKLPSTPGKRKRTDERPYRSSRDSSSRSNHHHHHKITKSKSKKIHHNTHEAEPSIYEFLKYDSLKPMNKNDLPFKFWTSLEPYCAPVTQNDVDRLGKLISKQDVPLPPIPELGPHFAVSWTTEDINNEHNASNTQKCRQKKVNNMHMDIPPHIATMLKRSDRYIEHHHTGVLTQRLLSSFLEIPGVEKIDTTIFKPALENNNKNYIKNGLQMEKRLRQELIDLGIMEEKDFPKPTDKDEILDEILKVESEIKTLNKSNLDKMKKLQQNAQEIVNRNLVRKKLDKIDREILEFHKKLLITKQEKKPFPKRDKDDTMKLVREQLVLNQQIELLPSEFHPWM